MSAPTRHITIFGAGALALGFLGPELHGDYRLTFVDIEAKADLLDALRRAGGYLANVAASFHERVDVTGCSSLMAGRDDVEIAHAIADSDIIFTSVGAGALGFIAPVVAVGAKLRDDAGQALNVLCCENGKGVAEGFREAVERSAGVALDGLFVADTVMGRMCRIEQPATAPNLPAIEGADWAVVGEPIYGIPVRLSRISDAGLFSGAFQVCDDAEFAARDDIKTYAHNGLHAFLAFLGHQRGYEMFHEAGDDAELMDLAWRVLRDEIGPAILAKHDGATNYGDYRTYAAGLLRRLVSRDFGDELARGARDELRKLSPNERFVAGARFVAAAGVRPTLLCRAMAAAAMACVGEDTDFADVDDLLARHCGLDADADAAIIEAVREGCDAPAGG